MTTTTLTILDTTVHGTASGNYDGSTNHFDSNSVRAANYYRGRGGVQTVGISVTGFVGDITIEGTLDSVDETANWFTTAEYLSPSVLTDYHPITVTGNFTWMRVRVTNFDDGTINYVNITY
jgi:hypothetical protein